MQSGAGSHSAVILWIRKPERSKLLVQNKAEEPAAAAYVSQLSAPRRQPALLKPVPWCGGISALQTSHPSLPGFSLSPLLVSC